MPLKAKITYIMVSETPSLSMDVGQKHQGQQLGRHVWGQLLKCLCVCHCGTTSKPLSSSPGEECARWVHGDASWAQLALLVYVAGCTFVCGCVCVYVSTALQYMPSWPKDGPANEKSSKQTGRRNHLGWKAAVTELISGSPLLPLTTCGFYTWR